MQAGHIGLALTAPRGPMVGAAPPSTVPADLTNAMRGGYFQPNITRIGERLLVGHSDLDKGSYTSVYNLNTGAKIADQLIISTTGNPDDHSPVTNYPLSNGKALCICCPHNLGTSHKYRIFDPTTDTFSAEFVLSTNNNVSYAIPVEDGSGRVWHFYRYNNSEWHVRTAASLAAVEAGAWSTPIKFCDAGNQMYLHVRKIPGVDGALIVGFEQPEDGNGRIYACWLDFTTAAYNGGTDQWTAAIKVAADDFLSFGTVAFGTRITNWKSIWETPGNQTTVYGSRCYDISPDLKALTVASFTKASIATTGVDYLVVYTGSELANDPLWYRRSARTAYDLGDTGGSFGEPLTADESYFAETRFNYGASAFAYSLFKSWIPPGSGSYTNGRIELMEGNLPDALSRSLLATSAIVACRPHAPRGGDGRMRYSWLEHQGFVAGTYRMVNPVIKFSNTTTAFTTPTITSAAVVFNVEGATLLHALTASEAGTWSILGAVTRDGFGADNGKVELNGGSNIRWLSNGVKDFDAPDNAQGDGIARVRVCFTATASGAKVYQNLSIVVTTNAAASLWTPAAEGADNLAWWNADDLADGAVTTWTDRSGNAIGVTQATGANKPVRAATNFNGKAGVDFDGVNDILALATMPAVLTGINGEIAWVSMSVDADAVATSRRVFAYGNTTTAARRTMGLSGSNLNAAEFDGGVSLVDSDSAAMSGITLLVNSVSGTSQFGRRDGRGFAPSASATRVNLATANNRVAIGGSNGNTAAAWFDGRVRHAGIMANRTLPKILRLEGYLAHDAGMASLLPANHPFKLNPPTV